MRTTQKMKYEDNPKVIIWGMKTNPVLNVLCYFLCWAGQRHQQEWRCMASPTRRFHASPQKSLQQQAGKIPNMASYQDMMQLKVFFNITNSQSLEDAQVGYISQKYTLDKWKNWESWGKIRKFWRKKLRKLEKNWETRGKTEQVMEKLRNLRKNWETWGKTEMRKNWASWRKLRNLRKNWESCRKCEEKPVDESARRSQKVSRTYLPTYLRTDNGRC